MPDGDHTLRIESPDGQVQTCKVKVDRQFPIVSFGQPLQGDLDGASSFQFKLKGTLLLTDEGASGVKPGSFKIGPITSSLPLFGPPIVSTSSEGTSIHYEVVLNIPDEGTTGSITIPVTEGEDNAGNKVSPQCRTFPLTFPSHAAIEYSAQHPEEGTSGLEVVIGEGTSDCGDSPPPEPSPTVIPTPSTEPTPTPTPTPSTKVVKWTIKPKSFTPNGDGSLDIALISVEANGPWTLSVDEEGEIYEGEGDATGEDSIRWDGIVNDGGPDEAFLSLGTYTVRLTVGSQEWTEQVFIDSLAQTVALGADKDKSLNGPAQGNFGGGAVYYPLVSARTGQVTRTVKPINLPSWKKVQINMEHIMSGHTTNGFRYKQNLKMKGNQPKDAFPDHMTEVQIEKAIREAYRFSDRRKVQGDQVMVRGTARTGQRIEMWVNTKTKMIETAYPTTR